MIKNVYSIDSDRDCMAPAARMDLHVHTLLSGGDLTLYQQFVFARRHGITGIAVTDRDVLPDIERAREMAEYTGVQLIPGVEITAGWKGHEVHVLAYNMDCSDGALRRRLEQIRTSRVTHIEIMLYKLRKRGMDLSLDSVRRAASEQAPLGSIHLARAMLAGGYIQSLRDAFTDQLIGVDGECYFPTSLFPVTEIIELIRVAGGIPVIAHPGLHNHRCGFNEDEIRTMKDAGLLGIEVLHPCHSPADEQRYGAMARTLGLFIAGGSSCRGPNYDPPVTNTVGIPSELLHPIWRQVIPA
jgi:predicted metal-dependent phosphoesterase TrpH